MKHVTITMYYWAGEKFGVRIQTPCAECDINHAILESMKDREFKDKPVEIVIKPWLTHLWGALRHGGWHPPVVLVNGKRFSQGVVIDRAALSRHVQGLLAL